MSDKMTPEEALEILVDDHEMECGVRASTIETVLKEALQRLSDLEEKFAGCGNVLEEVRKGEAVAKELRAKLRALTEGTPVSEGLPDDGQVVQAAHQIEGQESAVWQPSGYRIMNGSWQWWNSFEEVWQGLNPRVKVVMWGTPLRTGQAGKGGE